MKKSVLVIAFMLVSVVSFAKGNVEKNEVVVSKSEINEVLVNQDKCCVTITRIEKMGEITIVTEATACDPTSCNTAKLKALAML